MFGQSNLVKEISPLITEATIDEAEKKVDDYLTQDPNNVDALMMKGNITYYKFSFSQPEVALLANDNESIFDQRIGFIKPFDQMVPENIARETTGYFLKAVAIDNSRVDIHLGICQMYSISGMTDELIAYLPLIRKLVTEPDFEYTLCDYARNLKDRGRFDDCMKVYKVISDIYPASGGVISDMAAEYLMHDDFPNAKKCIDIAIKKPNADEMTFRNAFFINSLLGDYTYALDLSKKISLLVGDKEYLLYQALLELRKGENYKLTSREFLKSESGNQEEKKLAGMLASEDFTASIEDYDSICSPKVEDSYDIVIHDIFRSKFPQAFKPKMNLGKTYLVNSLFQKAVEVFNETDTIMVSQQDKETYLFYSAYANHKSGNEENAIKLWKSLLESKEFYYESAAAYFIGRYYENMNEIEKAKEYYHMVSSRANDSKYATYCWNRLK
jgi:tetratricopeptide (TPR) repeat protein